jgi:rubrerythrin
MSDPQTGSALQILERAMCLEVDSESFYREAAERTADRKGRRMFLDLAEEEATHQRLVQRQLDSLKSSGAWVADERFRGASCDLSQSLFPQGAAREKATGERANELEALWFALEKEVESYELYRQGALQTGDDIAQALYQFLMNAERQHFETLMTVYEGIVRGQYRPRQNGN